MNIKLLKILYCVAWCAIFLMAASNCVLHPNAISFGVTAILLLAFTGLHWDEITGLKATIKNVVDAITIRLGLWLIGGRDTPRSKELRDQRDAARAASDEHFYKLKAAIKERDSFKAQLAALCAADGWVENTGGMPVKEGTVVDVVYRNCKINLHTKAGIPFDASGSLGGHFAYGWALSGSDGDIIWWRKHKRTRTTQTVKPKPAKKAAKAKRKTK